jgi:hypothetical protein
MYDFAFRFFAIYVQLRLHGKKVECKVRSTHCNRTLQLSLCTLNHTVELKAFIRLLIEVGLLVPGSVFLYKHRRIK